MVEPRTGWYSGDFFFSSKKSVREIGSLSGARWTRTNGPIINSLFRQSPALPRSICSINISTVGLSSARMLTFDFFLFISIHFGDCQLFARLPSEHLNNWTALDLAESTLIKFPRHQLTIWTCSIFTDFIRNARFSLQLSFLFCCVGLSSLLLRPSF